MAVQMAEYVAQAVIRHFRGSTATRPIWRGQVAHRKPRLRADYVGVMGLGVLGERVARAALFDFRCAAGAAAPSRSRASSSFSGGGRASDFLRGTRVLVNLLPLTPETENIIDRARWRAAPGAYVINVARGAHLVDDDLLALLDSGHSRAPRWTCSAPSRCPPAIRSGATRASPSRPTPRRARCARRALPRSWARSRAERGEAIAGVVDRRGY
jgi:glyoxylate/hydroxypyruvate reductase A